MGFCQLNYLARTAPRPLLTSLFEWYDQRFRDTFENVLGEPVSDTQWFQATLPISSGGLGLYTESIPVGSLICRRADLAFLVANRTVASRVKDLLATHKNRFGIKT